MAREMSLSQTALTRIWHAFGLQPHGQETFKLSSDPLFIDKVRDIVGLYLDPLLKGMVLCVDEMNAVSHCLWAAEAFFDERPGVRLPVAGVHQLGCEHLLGSVFETLLGRRSSPATISRTAAGTAVTAYVVDYRFVPDRFTPGFEAHVPPR